MKEKKLVRPQVVTSIDFPGNSDKEKEERERERLEEDEDPVIKLEPIIKGKVAKEKKGFFHNMKEAFVGNSSDSLLSYILYDIFIPVLKDAIHETVTGGVDILLFGERSQRPRYTRDKSRTYTSYSSYYGGPRVSRFQDDIDDRVRIRNRAQMNFNDVVLERRTDAEDVLTNLIELTTNYGIATVSDFYQLVGLESQFTDDKYGWTNLKDAYVERGRKGYYIRLPRARPI